MPKKKTRSVDLTPTELYQVARALAALADLHPMLKKRWGPTSATVLHVAATAADLDDVLLSEASYSERTVLIGQMEGERKACEQIKHAALTMLDALPKPG